MDREEIGCEDVSWFELAHGRVQWRKLLTFSSQLVLCDTFVKRRFPLQKFHVRVNQYHLLRQYPLSCM
jgi:hypothetical protein